MGTTKYLFINSVAGSGSTGKIAAMQCRILQEQGNQCVLAYGRWKSNCDDINTYRIGTALDYKIHGIYTRLFDRHGFGSKLATRKFLRWVEEYNPDVIWLHNVHGYYLNIELLFEWLKVHPEIKKQWTLHDCWTMTGHCTHFTYVGCNRWKYQCYDCPQKCEYPKSILIDNCKQNYLRKKKCLTNVANMTIITPSNWLKKIVQQSYLGNYEIKMINNEVDLSMFKPTHGNFKDRYKINQKIVLGVANIWNDRKGLKDYYKLADALGEHYKIVLVGLTKKQLGEIPDNIIGIEKTDCVEALAEIYTAASVFVNFTYEDTYPTVNLEAQACGTPCITYDTGGSPECVPNANVVKRGDINKVVHMILNEQYVRKDNENCI